MNGIWDKIKGYVPALPAVAVAVCVGISLAGYQPEKTEAAETSPSATEDTENTDSSSDSNSEPEEKGSFDVEDGVYTGSAQGYSGLITVQVTVKNKQITDIEILSESDTDTFFNRAKGVIDEIIDQQSLDVDVVSGATYSSNGIINAVKNALGMGESSDSTAESTSSDDEDTSGQSVSGVKDGTYTGSGKGFSGTTTVSVTISGGKITAIDILSYGDTPSYFNRAKAVIDKIIAAQSTDVDVVSGATYSSRGIIAAVNSALDKAKGGSGSDETGAASGSSGSSGTSSGSSTTAAKNVTDTSGATYKDGTYTGTGTGFGGTMTVSVTISGGKITSIDVISNQDTPAYFNRAKTILNTMIEKQTAAVDGVSGATYSSNGLKEAVSNALQKAVVSGSANQTNTNSDQNTDNQNKDQEKDKEDEQKSDTKGSFDVEDGTYEGSAQGFSGEVTVQVTVKDKQITAIDIISESDTDTFFNQAKAVIDKIISAQSTDVDVVSGATYSSNGIINAVKNALEQKNDEDGSEDEQKSDIKGSFDAEDGTYEGSAQGFSGEVTVQVTVKDKQITAIDIISESDTDTFFNQAKAVIDKIISAQSTDVDVVSGATYSSNGIINAVKNALNQKDEEADSKDKEQEKDNDQKGNSGWKDGTYEGSGKGFGGTVWVSVVISGNKITAVNILSNEDTASFFNQAKGVIDEVISSQSTDVDVVSGATYSSKGILSAIQSALNEASGGRGVLFSKQSADDSGDTGETDAKNFPYPDGTYEGTGEGMNGDITLAVTIRDSQIVAIQVKSEEDDEPFFSNAGQVMKDIIAKQSTDVDAVSGATYSSNGILDAVQDALTKAKAASEEQGETPTPTETPVLTGTPEPTETPTPTVTPEPTETPAPTVIPEPTGTPTVTPIPTVTPEPTVTPTPEPTVTPTPEAKEYVFTDGDYTITIPCSPDEYEDFRAYNLTMTVTVQNDRIADITDISGDGDSSNNRYISRAANGTSKYTGIVEQVKNRTNWTADENGSYTDDIDTVSGATCSSKALLKGIDKALKDASK